MTIASPTSSTGSARLLWERYRQTNYDVGGVRDELHGWRWDRDAWTLVLGHTWVIGESRLNELRGQLASRDVYFPTNSSEVGEFFSSGATLQTGGHWVGPDGQGLANIVELRDTFTWQLGNGRHQLRAGASWMHYEQDYREDRFGFGLLVYATDDRSLPYRYLYGEGSSRIDQRTDYLGVFVHDDWRPTVGSPSASGCATTSTPTATTRISSTPCSMAADRSTRTTSSPV